MALGRDDELDLIKQITSLQVMIGQEDRILKEMREDLKALMLEYRNYRQDTSVRLAALEREMEDMRKQGIIDRLEELEAIKKQIRTGWLIIVSLITLGYTVFSEDIKRFLH